jgi:DNA polymerase III subunit epsilon
MTDEVSDRDLAIIWAREVLADPNSVIMDTETTGLGDDALVVQIAVINPKGETLLNTLVNPEVPIPADAQRIHGITDEIVKSAPLWKDVAQQFASVVAGKTVTIYNAAYDTRIIRQANKKAAYDIIFKNDCAMEQYAAFVGEWNEYRGNYRWQRLEGGDHSALGDCLATLDVIKKMASAELENY